MVKMIFQQEASQGHPVGKEPPSVMLLGNLDPRARVESEPNHIQK